MDFYQVLEKRRTIRDFSDKEVTDKVLEKVLSAAFKAPTYNPQIEMFARFKMKSSFHKTKRII